MIADLTKLDNRDKFDLLNQAKVTLDLALTAIGLVTLADGERGKSRSTLLLQNMRDILNGPNGLDSYIKEIDEEAKGPLVPNTMVTDWAGIAAPEGCLPVKHGDDVFTRDFVYMAGEWMRLEDTFSVDTVKALTASFYDSSKFLLAREQARRPVEIPLPTGYRELLPAEVIRGTDLAYTDKNNFSPFSILNKEAKDAIGQRYGDVGFYLAVRRLSPPIPSGYARLREGQAITFSDLILHEGSWMAINSVAVTRTFGHLSGKNYIKEMGIIVFREGTPATPKQVQ